MERVPLSANEAERFLLRDGDLLFARASLTLEGSGKCSIVYGSAPERTFESHLIRVRVDANQADSRFYYYFFRSHHGRTAIRAITDQVSAAGIRASDLARLQVPVPSLPIQRRIAHIIGSLDDKIELNRRMNRTLEKMAAAIFRSWFIDFDPVRAKVDGRDPGLPAEIADLFPDTCEDSVLGQIPKGWKVGSLGDVADSPRRGVKPGGLVVDYLGIADALKHALHTYTASGGKGQATVDQEQAAAVMVEKYEVVCDLLHGFDHKAILKAVPAQRMSGVAQAMEFVLSLDDGKTRFVQAVGDLSKAFALAVPNPRALAIRDEIGLFQEIRSALIKVTMSESESSPDDMESAIRQLVSRAVYSTEVVDIFAAAGLEKPDISILSDEFLADVQRLPQRNLALELLKKLINDEIKTRMRKNVVQARSFAEMLEQAVRKYQNRALEAAQVIDELIRIAKEMRLAESRGRNLGLSDDEVAFYDALAENDSAKQVIGDEKLRFLAQELVERVKQSVTIDWQVRENARAHIRVLVKRVLRKYGYPPDMQTRATELVLEQAEVLCKDWSTGSE